MVWAFAYNQSSPPDAPPGWTTLLTSPNDGLTSSFRLGYRRLQTGDTSTGSWLGASEVVVGIWRGVLGIGATAQAGASGTTLTVPGLTLQRPDACWVAYFYGVSSSVTHQVCSGTTYRVRVSSYDQLADTNAYVTTWDGCSFSISNQRWRAASVEIYAPYPGELPSWDKLWAANDVRLLTTDHVYLVRELPDYVMLWVTRTTRTRDQVAAPHADYLPSLDFLHREGNAMLPTTDSVNVLHKPLGSTDQLLQQYIRILHTADAVAPAAPPAGKPRTQTVRVQ